MNNPLVSIIIPTYNRAELIGETLDSVLAQTYANWECIIVDDGSTDNSDEVIGEYVAKDARFKYHQRPADRPKGGNAARNYGFEVSKGEYINWFDSDDVMLPDFLKVKIDLFTLDLNFVITTGYDVDSILLNRKKIELYQTDNIFKEYVLWKLKILTPSVLIRKSTLDPHLDLFSEEITRGQETEFFSRLFFGASKQQFLISNIPLFLYRQHDNTKTQHNNLYVNHFKFSQTLIAIENFKKSIILNDLELINYIYLGVLNHFFLALSNNDKKTYNYIIKEFIPEFKKNNNYLAVQFKFFANFLILINRSSYRIERYFKSKTIK